jgi:HD-GYP domain-containing protein (c-di-GMP phosphodiesterase class II)
MDPDNQTALTIVGTEAPVAKRSSILSTLSRMWIPVRAKITLPFILVAMAMAAFVAFLLYQIVFENIDQRYNTQLVESGKLASEWMVQEENARLASLRILAYTVGVGDALQDRDAEMLRLIALGSTIGKQEDAVEFLDTEGKLVLSMRQRPGSLYVDDYIFATGSEVNYRQWSFIDQVLTRHEDAQGDKYVGLVRASWGDYFYVSGPVYNSKGEFAGVILVGRLMQNMVTQMRLDTGSQVTIYDLEGLPIASTFELPKLNLALVVSVIDRQQNNSLRRDSDGKRSLTYRSIDYGEILGPWKLRGNQDLGLIGTAIPKNLLVKTSNATRTQIAIFVGLAMFLVIVMGGTIASLITRPLLELVKASKEVARGNWDVEVKPHANDEVAVLTENFNRMLASIQESHTDLMNAYNSTLIGWAKAIGLRDNETETHMQRVTEITIRLAQSMGLTGEQLTHIYRGTLLHDVGKIGVPDSILKKPGKLTEEEWVQMRMHPQFAYDMLYSIEYMRPSLEIPYCHHEKWDGSGYPRGIKGEDIPLFARIFSIVDVWDAMTSDRIYRKALSEEDAFQYISSTRGAHFDPQVVDAFLSMMGKS